MREDSLNPREIAEKVVEAASDKQAVDIILLDTHSCCSFTDYFVICSGESNRQINAIRDAITEEVEKAGVPVLHHEGNAASGWILLDFGDVVVHIFASDVRKYYGLDQLWSNAPLVLRVQ
jgi:ribosome-associated protein